MFYKNTGEGLDTLIPIDLRWYRSIIDSSTAFFNDVKLAPNVEVCTAVWRFDDHVVGVVPTTENNPVIDLLENLSRKWMESTNTRISNSSSRG